MNVFKCCLVYFGGEKEEKSSLLNRMIPTASIIWRGNLQHQNKSSRRSSTPPKHDPGTHLLALLFCCQTRSFRPSLNHMIIQASCRPVPMHSSSEATENVQASLSRIWEGDLDVGGSGGNEVFRLEFSEGKLPDDGVGAL